MHSPKSFLAVSGGSGVWGQARWLQYSTLWEKRVLRKGKGKHLARTFNPVETKRKHPFHEGREKRRPFKLRLGKGRKRKQLTSIPCKRKAISVIHLKKGTGPQMKTFKRGKGGRVLSTFYWRRGGRRRGKIEELRRKKERVDTALGGRRVVAMTIALEKKAGTHYPTLVCTTAKKKDGRLPFSHNQRRVGPAPHLRIKGDVNRPLTDSKEGDHL